MGNDNMPRKCWLGKLNKQEGFQEPAPSSKGLGISPSPETPKQTLEGQRGREAERPTHPLVQPDVR